MPNGPHDAPESLPLAAPPAPSPWTARARLGAELIVGALLVIGVIWLILLNAKTSRLRRELRAARDSVALVTGYNYGGLVTEILDLQTELYARRADTIPVVVGPVQLPPAHLVTNVRPMPAFPASGPSAEEQSAAAARIAGVSRSTQGEVRVVVHQSDVQRSGAAARLSALGFTVEQGAVGHPDSASNAITVGAQVSESDARAVCLAMIAAGMNPKRLRRSKNPALARKIEIEYVQALVDWPGLKVADLDRIASN